MKQPSYNTDNDRSSYYRQRDAQRRRDRRISNLLLILAVIFVIIAVILLLIDPIKNKKRNDVVENAVESRFACSGAFFLRSHR